MGADAAIQVLQRGWRLVHCGFSRGRFAHMLLNIKDAPKIGHARFPRESRRSRSKVWRWSDPLDRIGVYVPLSGERT